MSRRYVDAERAPGVLRNPIYVLNRRQTVIGVAPINAQRLKTPATEHTRQTSAPPEVGAAH
jgi:hypothetical protein